MNSKSRLSFLWLTAACALTMPFLRILIAMDDGSRLKGSGLASEAVSIGATRFTVVCPDREKRSATGTGLTMQGATAGGAGRLPVWPGVNGLGLQRHPFDCVKLALAAAGEPPEAWFAVPEFTWPQTWAPYVFLFRHRSRQAIGRHP